LFLFYFLGGFHQKRLLEKLFRKYNPIERPVEKDTESLNVTIGLALQQIVDVVSQISIFFILFNVKWVVQT